MAARDDVDRIDLHHPQPAQHPPHPVDALARRRPGQVLAADRQPPRLLQAQLKVIRHPPILQDFIPNGPWFLPAPRLPALSRWS